MTCRCMLWQACTGGDSHCASLEEPSDHIVRFVESFQVCALPCYIYIALVMHS